MTYKESDKVQAFIQYVMYVIVKHFSFNKSARYALKLHLLTYIDTMYRSNSRLQSRENISNILQNDSSCVSLRPTPTIM